ncbi:hypothetical protein [Massilibacteroides sp.]|uniref:hypothetical protein n=1 Tax=Massilibacteroides sp. TaxID=2034766 RepID=UPI00260A0FA4|nr:hypothetical protein [Massilibacteroides sp.]MDD4516699.1 hypothetical protein [Massilibacteroides sp.]
MKTKLILIISCFIIGGVNAQNSKFFSIDSTYSTTMILAPKGIQIDKKTPLKGHYSYDMNERFMQEITQIYYECFGEVDEEIKTALFRGGELVLFFDKNYHIYYFQFYFLNRYSTIILGIEDKLNEYAKRFKKMDLASFIKIDEDRGEFHNSKFSIFFAAIFNYEKFPEKFRAEKLSY